MTPVLGAPTAAAARRRASALGAAGEPGTRPGLERWVAGLGLDVDAGHVARILPAMVGGVAFVSVVAGGPALTIVVFSAMGAVAGWLSKGSTRRRAAAIDRDLPLVLEAVARHLRSGGSLAQAIVAAGPSTRGALGETWERLRADLEVRGVVAALDGWVKGRGCAGAVTAAERLAATALALAAETGGSPARAVDGVAATLRARRALGEEIRALSSQARASAAVIALAPLAFGLLAGANDDRTSTFFRSPVGLVLLSVGLGLDALGAWWMSRLCRMPVA